MARMVSCGSPCSCVQVVRVYCVSFFRGLRANALPAHTTSANKIEDRFRPNRGLTGRFQYKAWNRDRSLRHLLLAADSLRGDPAQCGQNAAQFSRSPVPSAHGEVKLAEDRKQFSIDSRVAGVRLNRFVTRAERGLRFLDCLVCSRGQEGKNS